VSPQFALIVLNSRAGNAQTKREVQESLCGTVFLRLGGRCSPLFEPVTSGLFRLEFE
jgi:hypothetical protein